MNLSFSNKPAAEQVRKGPGEETPGSYFLFVLLTFNSSALTIGRMTGHAGRISGFTYFNVSNSIIFPILGRFLRLRER